jgi:hypothetical protein
LLNGELALGIYHDSGEEIDQDAIKMDFLETAGRDEWRLFRNNQVRIGLSVSEARALLDRLAFAIEDCESMRAQPKKTKKARTSGGSRRS